MCEHNANLLLRVFALLIAYVDIIPHPPPLCALKFY